MSLEDNIVKAYADRENKSELYNSVYSQKSYIERKEMALQLVKRVFSDRSDKLVLEIGAGQGDNVDLLRHCGFKDENIYLNELLPERLASIKARYPHIQIIPGDASCIDLIKTYDVIFQSTVFTSVLNQEDRKKLARAMWTNLNPGGVILWYDFIYNNPSNQSVRKVSVAELKTLFPNAKSFTVKKITLAPPIGRRVGRFYKWFNFPFFRSHVMVLISRG